MSYSIHCVFTSKFNWKNPRVYCVAVILLGLMVVIVSNAMSVRYGRTQLELRSLGLVITGLGLFGVLLIGISERTARNPRRKSVEIPVIVARPVFQWEIRICRGLGILFSILAMMWFVHSAAAFLVRRFNTIWFLNSVTLFLVCVGLATLSFLVESLFSKR